MKFLLMICLVFLTGCVFKVQHSFEQEIVDAEIRDLTRIVNKKFGLFLVTQAIAYNPRLEKVHLVFGTYEKLEIPELRAMICEMYAYFIEQLKDYSFISCDLARGQDILNQINLSIMCLETNDDLREEGLAGVMCVKNKILYKKTDPSSGKLEDVLCEKLSIHF